MITARLMSGWILVSGRGAADEGQNTQPSRTDNAVQPGAAKHEVGGDRRPRNREMWR